ncbi:hypothetical protein GCM10011316_01960 [Roseibium aquae]|uniref:DUF2764 family protein n=1 Tax=Roseibium aquae TaxID=1323746 RepID=A0A916WUD6_9HYPH|nr:hypothetical protein [Roseibium aquae]GGB33509.1 hypothetical protein GCM10011316_01960 [Roseibium aquae]
MSERMRYITLATSLPYLGRLFAKADIPISRFRLEQRLGMLTPGHRRLLDRVIQVTAWAGVAPLQDDKQIISLARSVIDDLSDHPDLQHLVSGRMETRTLMAALRRRRDGQQTPGDVDSWGYGRWNSAIAANWSDQAFGLGHFMPWIAKANQAMLAGDHLSVERTALTEVIRQIDHYGQNHAFDFEAVVIYVLKWTVFARWAAYSQDKAAQRLSGLIDAVLATAPDLPGGPVRVPAEELSS